MHVLKARNVHEALPQGMAFLVMNGRLRESRNGDVIVADGPVTTLYERPTERVMFHAHRDCNPFFHFIESLWMISGRNDVALPASYVSTMANFSDDGKTFHGAYGHRWRKHFNIDQLATISDTLRANPTDRRCVLQMWDSPSDLGKSGKDFPCNTQVYFAINLDGDLDMTVCCRSNDMIWGAYGANAVHFSMLQEYMAGRIGVGVGRYWQVSNNFHAYKKVFDSLEKKSTSSNVWEPCPYSKGIEPYPIFQTNATEWDQDLLMFLDEGVTIGLRNSFFRKVAQPIVCAHKAYKSNKGIDKYDIPLEILDQCAAADWRMECTQWILRRKNKYLKVSDDGPIYDGP